MTMPKGYEDKDEKKNLSMLEIQREHLKLTKIQKKYTKPTKKYVKFIWIVFWIVIGLTQVASGFFIHDPSHFQNLPEGGYKDYIREIPDEIHPYVPHLIFGALIHTWYFSIKHRHSRITLVLMSIVIAPPLAVVGFYAVLILAIIAVFAIAIFLALLMSGSGRKAIRRNFSGYTLEEENQIAQREYQERMEREKAEQSKGESWWGWKNPYES